MDKRTETIRIAGMSCGHCVSAVRRALGDVEGLEVHDVSIGEACVVYDAGSLERVRIDAAIEDAGFTVVAVQ